ncbi:MAG: Tfp pilus assembly protein FimT/FimU, partial [Candidatus Zixiibacteriota bacterium]
MRKQFNHRIAGARGFTLMEMMISVVIIGVVATLAGPRLGKELTRIEFKGSTQDLISTLRQARSLAITEKTPHAVGIDNATGAYTLFKEGATNDIIVRSSKIPGEYPSVSQSFAGPV